MASFHFPSLILDIGDYGIISKIPENFEFPGFIVNLGFGKEKYIISTNFLGKDNTESDIEKAYKLVWHLHKYLESDPQIISKIPFEENNKKNRDFSKYFCSIYENHIFEKKFYNFIQEFEKFSIALILSAAFQLALFNFFLSFIFEIIIEK